VSDVLDDLDVAAVGRIVLGRAAGLRAAGPPPASTPSPFGSHALRLTAFRLGELSCDYDEAQVEHEERTDLNHKTSYRYIESSDTTTKTIPLTLQCCAAYRSKRNPSNFSSARNWHIFFINFDNQDRNEVFGALR